MVRSFIEIFEEFRRAGVEDPLAETLRLADLVAGGALRRSGLKLLEERGIDIAELARQRAGGRPLEYILGVAPFLGEILRCAPGALIPREETELLALTCLDYIASMQNGGRRDLNIVEIGTGSGNIAVLLALRSTGATIYASDISAEAIEVARENVERFGVGDRVRLFCGDLFEPLRGLGLEGRTDLVVCNPPYIPSSSVDRLDPAIRDHEPRVALDAGAYGIDIFRRLIADAPDFLRPGGVLAFEIGAGQERFVDRLFDKTDCAYSSIEHFDDGEKIRVFGAVRA
ncbi:MAG: peptide chain release factor N(5)-glutamine methyltransferase [Candidatus Krumholzibacteria bacterium]|nr:peptide chain release factor N(5)-glutamine methyltransferase [Candidatus Krumholzibacteria bacterium]